MQKFATARSFVKGRQSMSTVHMATAGSYCEFGGADKGRPQFGPRWQVRPRLGEQAAAERICLRETDRRSPMCGTTGVVYEKPAHG